jgi:hypothetical protein
MSSYYISLPSGGCEWVLKTAAAALFCAASAAAEEEGKLEAVATVAAAPVLVG